jgi:hypothetical protein
MDYELTRLRCFLAAYIFAWIVLFCCSYFGAADLVNGYLHVPTTGLWSEISSGQPVDLTLALTVLASVAVVVWTGGLVALQLKKADLKTSFAMDLLGICFIGCTLTIIAHWSNLLNHHALRFVVTLFALRYLGIYVHGVLVASKNNYKPGFDYCINGLRWLMPIYAIVIAFPLQDVVAWIGVITLYFGLWNVLQSLRNLPPDKPIDVRIVP